MAITRRLVKGAPLTAAEHDANVDAFDKFKGRYTNLAAITAALTTPNDGDYALNTAGTLRFNAVDGTWQSENLSFVPPTAAEQYADTQELVGEQANQVDRATYEVVDASDDPAVAARGGSSTAHYRYLGSVTGDLTAYELLPATSDTNTAPSPLPSYQNEIDMYLDQSNQRKGYFYFVGAIAFLYLGTLNGDSSDYISINDIDEINSANNLVFSKNIDAYGDSITVGQGSTSGNSYIELLRDQYDLSLSNKAVSGRGVYEAARRNFLSSNTSNENKDIVSVMAGFNDVRRGSGAKTFAKIDGCISSMIANSFLESFEPATDSSPNVNVSGIQTVYDNPLVGGKVIGCIIRDTGDYIEYSFTGDNVVVGMSGADSIANDYGTYTISIDGIDVLTSSANDRTDGISDGSNSNERAPYNHVFTDLGLGNHTVRVTLLEDKKVAFDYFGQMMDAAQCSPFVIFDAPKMNASGYATLPHNNANDLVIDQLNELYRTVALKFKGYPIFHVETNSVYDVSTGLSGDNIHPNNIGYNQIFLAAKNVFDSFNFIGGGESDLLNSANEFTESQTYQKQNTHEAGILIRGGFPVTPGGKGLELQWSHASNKVFITALDRDTNVWQPLVIRAGDIEIMKNNVMLPSDTFTTVDGKTVTVTNGLITSIS